MACVNKHTLHLSVVKYSGTCEPTPLHMHYPNTHREEPSTQAPNMHG
jgi:hypothetical protein